MKLQRTATLATYGCLSLAAAVSFLLPSTLLVSPAHASLPEKIRLTGKVTDFRRSHADFNVVPSGGPGHYAGNVSTLAGSDGLPIFTGAGGRVDAQWIERHNEPFAPHLYHDPSALYLGSAPGIDAGAYMDTWDSALGPYGPGNQGPAPSVVTGATMPSISAPSGMPASAGDPVIGAFSTPTYSTDQHWNTFQPGKNTTITISGNVTILCDADFVLNKECVLNLEPGAKLDLYVGGLFKVGQLSTLNMNTFDPNRVRIFNLGTTQMEINQSSSVCATIYSPNAPLHLAQNDHFYGKFFGQGLQIDQDCGFHADTGPYLDACSVALTDTPGSWGPSSKGGISTATTFNEWYRDILGTNLSQSHTIELLLKGGVYEFTEPEFHPIDNMLLGNEGDAHNYFFTYAIETAFVYDACTEQFFEFAGSDDAWVFVDGRLAMDLGGIVPGTNQYVDMDRLFLTDGQTYTFTFFYAQRQDVHAGFSLRTNIPFLVTPPTFTVSATVD